MTTIALARRAVTQTSSYRFARVYRKGAGDLAAAVHSVATSVEMAAGFSSCVCPCRRLVRLTTGSC